MSRRVGDLRFLWTVGDRSCPLQPLQCQCGTDPGRTEEGSRSCPVADCNLICLFVSYELLEPMGRQFAVPLNLGDRLRPLRPFYRPDVVEPVRSDRMGAPYLLVRVTTRARAISSLSRNHAARAGMGSRRQRLSDSNAIPPTHATNSLRSGYELPTNDSLQYQRCSAVLPILLHPLAQQDPGLRNRTSLLGDAAGRALRPAMGLIPASRS